MVNWLAALISGLITLIAWILVGYLGFTRWWKRRRPVLQLGLMLVIMILVIGLTVLVALSTTLEFMDLAGLLFGVGTATMLFLVATSYLIEQIRVAFIADSADSDEPKQ